MAPGISIQPQLVQELGRCVHWRCDRCIDDSVRPADRCTDREARIEDEVAAGLQKRHQRQPRVGLRGISAGNGRWSEYEGSMHHVHDLACTHSAQSA